MNQIELSRFTSKNSMVLSGRDRGVDVRMKLALDKLDKEESPLTILVPDHIISLNSSFFQGLFGDSVRNLGEMKFRDKYRFAGSSVIVEDVEKGIVDSLNQTNPLG